LELRPLEGGIAMPDRFVTTRGYRREPVVPMPSASQLVEAQASAASGNPAIALQSREILGQATAVIMATMGCTAEQAVAVIAQQSKHERRRVIDVASGVADRSRRRLHGSRVDIDQELGSVAEVINACSVTGRPATTEDLRRAIATLRGHYVSSQVARGRRQLAWQNGLIPKPQRD
jgi:histidine ammonia-lyase